GCHRLSPLDGLAAATIGRGAGTAWAVSGPPVLGPTPSAAKKSDGPSVGAEDVLRLRPGGGRSIRLLHPTGHGSGRSGSGFPSGTPAAAAGQTHQLRTPGQSVLVYSSGLQPQHLSYCLPQKAAPGGRVSGG